MDPDPIQVALRVTSIFEEMGVPYFITGSIASTLHGMVRTTQDVDIVAKLSPNQVERFVSGLKGEFFIDEEMIRSAVARESSFNIIHRDTLFKVDVFVPRDDRFTRSQFSRTQRAELSEDSRMQAMVASPEDTVLSKLLWYRQGGEVSARQWRDILGLLKVQGKGLDLEYLGQTSVQLNVADLLEKALKER